MSAKSEFDAALKAMKRGKRVKAKAGRSTVTLVGKERAKKLQGK